MGIEIKILNGEKFTFQDKELIWDSMLFKYGIENDCAIEYIFPLINVDDLTQLAYQLDENNWQDLEFMKKFGINKKIIDFLNQEENDSKAHIILDNLANQILARCIIVANRLIHGVNKEFEKESMIFAFGYQSCFKFLELEIVQENNRQLLIDKANQAFSGDKRLLKILQDLPYLKEEFRLKD